MTQSPDEQTVSFLVFTLFGFSAALILKLFSLVLRKLKMSKAVFCAFDLLFCVLCFSAGAVLIAVRGGSLKADMVLGALLGAVFLKLFFNVFHKTGRF